MKRIVSAASTLVLLALGACSAEDGLGSQEQEKRISPTDAENLGRLLVTAPDYVEGELRDLSFASENGDDEVEIGVEKRFIAAEGCLRMKSGFGKRHALCGVSLTKGNLKTVKLGRLTTTYDRKAFATDVGPQPTLAVHFKGAGTVDVEQEVVAAAAPRDGIWRGDEPTGTPAFPGAYRFAWGVGVLPDVTKQLAPGAEANVALDPGDARSVIRLVAPTRELPDFTRASCKDARTYVSYASRARTTEPAEPANWPDVAASEGIESSRGFAVDQDTDVRVFAPTAAEAPKHFELSVNDIGMNVNVTPGQTTTVELQRIDVDHVAITTETGASKPSEGVFRLERKAANGIYEPVMERFCDPRQGEFVRQQPTGTGIDVLPGTYRVTIDYGTAEGSKTQQHVISVP